MTIVNDEQHLNGQGKVVDALCVCFHLISASQLSRCHDEELVRVDAEVKAFLGLAVGQQVAEVHGAQLAKTLGSTTSSWNFCTI